MSRIAVVDTSVAAKWFLDEPNAAQALRLLDDRWELHAPDFLDLELDHLLAKRFRRGELTRAEAASIRAAFAEFPIRRHDFHELQDAAFDLACRHQRGIYDALFVALALYLGARLVTADRRLYDALSDRPGIDGSLLWVGELGSEG